MTELRKEYVTDATTGATAEVANSTDRNTNLDEKNGLITAAIAFGRVSDTSVKHSRLDASTHALMTIDYAHHEIHDGTFFTFDDVIVLGNGAAQDYLITVPDTTRNPHIGFNIESCEGGIAFELFEASDRNGTTLQTMRNRNRNSATTATTTLHKGQTGGTTDGTRIVWRSVGTGTAGGRVSGNVGESTERILKQNTKYLLRVTSKANTNTVSVRIDWYEHVARE